MKIAFHVAFGIHLLSILGVIALLIVSYKKTPRALNPGVLHSAATALVAGVVMVGTWSAAHENEINHMKVGIKFLVVLAILVVGYNSLKKKIFTDRTFTVMLGLTVVNILLAYLW
ncbi:unannotated protein [freshwater metagenome]|jgi:hypothetical protein|uniref:Unannotated protein n=1 Tax=freshwater metagenome TaxID=449393 RepID=A0A6J6F6V8_9ZZZZ|nr:hypothetical protein [Actinomycetota bacterium]